MSEEQDIHYINTTLTERLRQFKGFQSVDPLIISHIESLEKSLKWMENKHEEYKTK